MPKNSTNESQPPPAGYPTGTGNPTTGKRCFARAKKRGDRGFIEGCLFALCCCWLCEECY